MPEKPNKLTQFWEELKRRKVIKVLAMYAATAFIIIEAGDIVLPRLGLPDWTVTFIIILLIIGFPITIILSWIFDITPEGLIKTEPVEAAGEKESNTLPSKRKPRLSDAIIAVLIVVVGILAYPKIFNKDKLQEMRDEDGRISIAVMPFGNLSGDTLYNVWQGGFQNLLITTLSNSEELLVRQYQAIQGLIAGSRNINYASLTPSLASELAQKLETRTFIMGNILKAGNKVRVNAQLVNAESEEIYKTFQVDGNTEDDIFAMADSLSGLIRNHLEIKQMLEQYDLPAHEEYFTQSSEAFQYYIHGLEAFMQINPVTAAEWFLKAIDADPDFLRAYGFLSFSYKIMGSDDLAKHWCEKVYEKRHELTLLGKLMSDHLHAHFFETPNEQIKYLEQILEIDELNPDYWYLLGNAYYSQDQFRNAISSYEKVLEIHNKWGTLYRSLYFYVELGAAYHLVHDHKREKEIYDIGLTLFPENPIFFRSQAICALSQGNLDKAENLIAQYRSKRKTDDQWTESTIDGRTGYIYYRAGIFEEAEKYFRKGLEMDSQNPERMYELAWLLIEKEINVNEGMGLIEKALELSPEDWYYLDTRGWGLYKLGRYEEALQILTDSWELRPSYNHEGYLHIQAAEKAIAN